MENVEIIFILLFIAVLLVGFAQKIHVPYPLLLVLGGAAISFIPGIDNIYLNPHLILLIFLPPILYYSAFGISFREFQRNWKNIFSLALGLVVLTAVVIGVLFKWLFPQFSWPLAFAFGAIISPPDAVAVTTILKRFNISSRLVTLLEGESLINDASAIVLYKITTIALVTGSLSLTEGSIDFFYVAFGGVLVGFLTGFLFQFFSRFYLEPVLGVVFSFTIPFVSYIIADTLNVSGVLAVVVNGLIGARILHTHQSLRRVLGYAIWDIFIILLNCFVFILIGLQISAIATEMSYNEIIVYSVYALLIAFAMFVIRLIWVYSWALLTYYYARLQSKELRFQIFKEAAIISWAGMRGIVSLAVALSLPFTISNGEPLQGRNDVIFITFMVILITLVIPGLTLPYLIRFLRLNELDLSINEMKIRKQLTQYTKEKIVSLFNSKTIDQKEYRFLKSYFHSHHKVLEHSHGAEKELSNIEKARRKVIHFQRLKLMEMWREYEIDDKLLNHLEGELDLWETHTARAELKN